MERGTLERIERFYASKRTRMILLGILLLLILFPRASLMEIPADGGTIPVSLFYIASLVFAPWLLLNLRRWRLPPWPITGLFAFVIVYTVFADLRWGFGRTLLNWVFGAYLLVVLVSMGRDLVWEDWRRILAWAMIVFAAAELVNVIAQLSTSFVELAERMAGIDAGMMDSYRPVLRSLTRGGPNLDASWLTLGCFFMYKRAMKYPYFAFAAAFSIVFFSRVGMVACGLYFVWAFFFDEDWRPNKKRIWIYLALLAAGVAVLLSSEYVRIAFERMTGKFNGGDITAGRSAMWSNAPQMFADNPFGYGCGNAMRVMKSDYGYASYEDNMHNVLLQFLLDEGFIGVLWFVGLCAAFYWKEGREGFRHPLAGYFFAYLVLSLVEFHGAEAQMQYVLGVYLTVRVLGVQPWPERKPKMREAVA